MMSSTLSSTNGHTAQPWLKETVQSFFEGFVWSGLAPVSLPNAEGDGIGATETLGALTVGQFFDRFPWEGQPTIGLPIAPLEAPGLESAPAADDLTLDDFSSLFG